MKSSINSIVKADVGWLLSLNVVDNEINHQKSGFYIKFALMISFITLDVYLNSKMEYEAIHWTVN